MTLKELRDKLAALNSQISAALKREETDPAQVQAQLDEVEKLQTERTDIETQIAKLEKIEQARLTEAKRLVPAGPSAGHGAADPDPADSRNGAPPQAHRFVIPARARHSGPLKNFVGTRDGYSAQERAFRFGQFALARLAAEMPGKFQFPQATRFVADYMAALHEETDTTGYHVYVPDEFGMDLVDLRERYGVARRVLKYVPMSSETRSDPRRLTGMTAYFVGEGVAGTTSNVTKDKIQLIAKKIMCLTTISSELNEDAVISVGDDIAGEIAYAFAYKEDDCAFNGTGASTYGGIYGLRPKLKAVGTAGLVTQATGTTWGAQVLADFNGVVGKLPQYADTPNTVWLCHKTYYHTVMQKLETAAGGVTAQEISDGRRGRPVFLGYPVEFSQVFPAATATTQLPVVLGDLTLAGRFGDRRRQAISFSEHATVGSDNVFATDEIAVKGTERIDINIHDVGDSTNAGPVVGLITG